jgi:hypothetical protein
MMVANKRTAELTASIQQEAVTVANPFTYGNPISDPSRFFGRGREVGQVISRLRNREFESSSIVGERRFGKTSLLNYLADPQVRIAHGLDPASHAFVYVDLSLVNAEVTPTRLWQRILRLIGREVKDQAVAGEAEKLRGDNSLDNFALEDFFDVVDDAGTFVALLLDEFENITENKHFGPDFYFALRSLAIHHNLSVITSSRQELIELSHSDAIRSSPFFNIFANINIRLLPEADARSLIATSLAGAEVQFSDEETDWLLEMAGCHPHLLQASAYFLFDARESGLPPESLRRVAAERFRAEAAPHLDAYWRSSSDGEKILLTTLALLQRDGKGADRAFSVDRLQTLYDHSEQMLTRLEKRGLIASDGDTWALMNTTFDDWIVSEIGSSLEDEQQFDGWLRGNETLMTRLPREAQEQAREILPKIGSKYRDLVVEWISRPETLMSAAALLKGVLY